MGAAALALAVTAAGAGIPAAQVAEVESPQQARITQPAAVVAAQQPTVRTQRLSDREIERRVNSLLARMTVTEKLQQIQFCPTVRSPTRMPAAAWGPCSA